MGDALLPGACEERGLRSPCCDTEDSMVFQCDVTAKFCRQGHEPGSKIYSRRQDVRDLCGKVSSMKVVGFVITPRTLGARVRLDLASLSLWGQDDKEVLEYTSGVRRNVTGFATGDVSGQSSNVSGNVNGDMSENVRRVTQEKLSSNFTSEDPEAIYRSSLDEDWEAEASQSNHSYLESNTTETQETSYQDHSVFISRFFPTAYFGESAHVTLGCASGATTVQTGLDQIDVIKRERKLLSNTDFVQLDGAVLRYYGDGCCVVYLDEEIDFEAMFAGFY